MTMFWPRSIFVINHYFSMWLEHTRTVTFDAGLLIQKRLLVSFTYIFFMVVFFHILVLALLLLSSSFSSLFSQKAEAVLNYLKSTKCWLDFRRYVWA